MVNKDVYILINTHHWCHCCIAAGTVRGCDGNISSLPWDEMPNLLLCSLLVCR